MAHLTALRAENFRCFERLSGALSPGMTVFIGDNAQGKTSVLEAVCVLLRLQSPRTSSLADLVRFDHPHGFGLAGDLAGDADPDPGVSEPVAAVPSPSSPVAAESAASERAASGSTIQHFGATDPDQPPLPLTPLKFLWQDGRRSLHAAGRSDLSPSRYLASSTVLVWMGNDDLALVRGSGEGRRRYLDFLGSQAFPAYRPALLAYDKALRARNRLLKDDHPDPRQIAAYTAPLLAHGTTLTRLRTELVDHLVPWAATAHHDISGTTAESLRLTYHQGATTDFAAALAASTAEESRRRLTVVGPHRDDLLLLLNDRPAAAFASEGQQRTIALALKLAQARLLLSRLHHPPLLLIDDIFGELDPRRRNALLHALPPASQQLVTTTHLDWTTPAFQPDHLYHVAQGTLHPR